MNKKTESIADLNKKFIELIRKLDSAQEVPQY